MRATAVALVALLCGCGTTSSAVQESHTTPDFSQLVGSAAGFVCAPGWQLSEEGGCSDGGAQANLWISHADRLGDGFVLLSAEYAIDGRGFARYNNCQDAQPEQRVFNVGAAQVPPGRHELAVRLRYRGNGHGVFSYLKGYKFAVRSSGRFAIPWMARTHVLVHAYERGDQNTPLEERPAVKLEVDSKAL